MPQLRRALVPRQQSRPCSRTPSSSACSIAAWSGFGSGPLASRIAPRRRLRVGVTEPVAGSKSPSWRVSIRSANRSRHGLLVDRAPRTGFARPTHGPPLRRPRAIRCRRAGMRGRAGSRGRRPIASSRRTNRGGGESRSGKARASACARARAPSTAASAMTASRRRQPAASFRAASARGDRSERQRRQRNSRSGSLPPKPRSVSSTATSAAAAAEAAIAGVDQHVRQARLERQRGNRAAMLGHAAARHRSRRAPPAAARFVQGRGGRRVEERAGARGRFAPQEAGQQQARQVGLKDLRRIVRGVATQWRLPPTAGCATPGAWRAARPARWVTAARLARSVTSRVRPAPRS